VTFAGRLHDVAPGGAVLPRGHEERHAVEVDCGPVELRVE